MLMAMYLSMYLSMGWPTLFLPLHIAVPQAADKLLSGAGRARDEGALHFDGVIVGVPAVRCSSHWGFWLGALVRADRFAANCAIAIRFA